VVDVVGAPAPEAGVLAVVAPDAGVLAWEACAGALSFEASRDFRSTWLAFCWAVAAASWALFTACRSPSTPVG
jgi:hypothetical protein